MKKIIIIIAVVLLVLFMLPVAIFFTVQHPAVQQRLVNEATHMLSEKLNTTVSVKSIQFRLFNRLVLNEVYVQDLKGDTLLYAGQVSLSLSRFRYAQRYIEVGTLALTDTKLALERDTSGVLNMKFILDGFKTKNDTVTQKPVEKKGYKLSVNRVRAEGVDFKFIDRLSADTTPDKSIDFANIAIRNLSLDVRELNLDGDTMSCRLMALQLHERSGFNLHHLSGFVSLAPTFIEIKTLQLQDDFSDVRAKYYRMDFGAYSDFSDYLEKVRMSADFTSAKVDLYTIGFFAKKLKGVHLPLYLSGVATGTVSNLKGRNLDISYGLKTNAKVNFSMTGLPDAANTFFTFDVKDLNSVSRDLLMADSAMLGSKFAQHAEMLRHLGALSGRARFTGFLSNFVADAALTTEAGAITTDLSFVPSQDTAVFINGTLGTDNFDIGAVLNDTLVGKLSFYGRVSGTFKSMKKLSLNADVDMPLLELNSYAYRDIKFKGFLTEKSFKGGLVCDDKNLNFDFIGKVDFEKSKPLFDFKLQLDHADLVKLNLNTRDSISQLSLTATADFEGVSLDDIEGYVSIADAKYTSAKGDAHSGLVRVSAKSLGESKNITLKSDWVDATLLAKGNVSDIIQVLDSVLHFYIPALSGLVSHNQKSMVAPAPQKGAKVKPKNSKVPTGAEYEVTLLTKKSEMLWEALLPGLMLADSTRVSGRFGSDMRRVRLSMRSTAIRFGKNEVLDVSLRSTVRDSVLTLNVGIDEANIGGLNVQELNITGALKNGKLDFTSDYQTAIASGKLNAQLLLFSDNQSNLGLQIDLFPSKVVLGDVLWDLSQSAVRIEKNRYTVSHFKIENAQQLLYVNGVISKNMTDTLACELRTLSIEPLLRLMGKQVDLKGDISGKVKVNGVLAPAPIFFANMRAKNIYFDKREVGNITLQSFTEEGEKDVTLQLRIERAGADKLSVAGVIKPSGEVVAQAKFAGMEIGYLNTLLGGVLSDIDGMLNGNVRIAGPLKNLQLNGKLQLDEGSLRVVFLNSLFKIRGPVELENSNLHMRDLTATDDKKGTAKLNFTLGNLTRPQKLYYSLKVEPRNMHVLNSNEYQNEMFYGQGYVSGVVQIRGGHGEVGINAVASTEPNTQLSIPLAGRVQEHATGFINFVTPADTLEKKQDPGLRTGTNLKAELDFQVTPDANVMLVLNQNTGDVIKAAGSGNVKLEVQPANNVFRIFGAYNLLHGEYTVSIQNILNLKFKIDNGSVINFNGNVDAATADIQASYKQLRVPLAGLFGDTTSRYKHPVPIDCKVRMTGRLTAPDLKFTINAPTVDAETRDRMQAQLNTDDNVVTQFMSLVLVGQFVQTDNTNIGQSLSGITLSDLISSQLASLVSQFADVNLNVNYTPASASNTGADVGVSLSKDVTERISVSAGVEYQSQRKQTDPNASPMVADFDFQYTVDKQGKLRVKAFSHANDQYTDMAQTTGNRYGVGVVYQEDFDSFADLWKAIFRKKKVQDSLKVEQKKEKTVNN